MLNPSDLHGGAQATGEGSAVWQSCRRIRRGIAAGLRTRYGVFLAVAAGVLTLEVLLPPAVLSAARRTVDYFTFNPWLRDLPAYLIAGDIPLQRKLDFLPGLALFWFSADSPFGGTDWGYAVTASDFVRFLLFALLFAAYFALLAHCGHRAKARLSSPDLGRKGGAIGVFTSAVGFSTGGCTVVGCGAPVMPVVGLAFVGLTSGTIAVLAELSRIASSVIFVFAVVGVMWLGWIAGKED